jgi:hypothetical protein
MKTITVDGHTVHCQEHHLESIATVGRQAAVYAIKKFFGG